MIGDLAQLGGGRLDEIKGFQAAGEHVRDVGVSGEKLAAVGRLARFDRRQVFLQGGDDARVGDRRRLDVPGLIGAASSINRLKAVTSNRVHELPPKSRRSRTRARGQRFLTLSSVRSIRWATCGNVSPSRWRRIIKSR